MPNCKMFSLLVVSCQLSVVSCLFARLLVQIVLVLSLIIVISKARTFSERVLQIKYHTETIFVVLK